MRLSAILFAAVVIGGAAAGAWKLGEAATEWFEGSTLSQLDAGLDAAGQDWAEVAVDGLDVTITGAAPDESSRFRALEIARRIVDERRIDDQTTLAAVEPLPPAPFALELLRNDDEISLIGLVPEDGGRDMIRAALGAGGLSEHVTDMLESASDAAPEGWREALGYGLSVLAELPRSKISVSPGEVRVIAVADSDGARGALETRLKRAVPSEVALTLEISAPRPVIAPFSFDFSLDADGTGHLAVCSADSDASAEQILGAARETGLPGDGACRVGLGAPSPRWAAAVASGLDALRTLGGGRFRMSDLDAELTAPPGADAEELTAASARLDAALPDLFQLATVVPPRMESGVDGEAVYTPRFIADLDDNGALRLSGPLKDPASQAAIASFAGALFGHDMVFNATVVDPALPDGWPGRVLAGVEALAALKSGHLAVTADAIAVEGSSIDPNTANRVEALLAAKVGDEGIVNIRFDEAAARAAELAARPRPEICTDQIAAILEVGSIQFDAGSADILPQSRGVLAAISDVLRGCPGANFEIAGYTDSQGPSDSNQRLSEARAGAVVAALRDEDLPLIRLVSRGYGEDRPIADNSTEAGRARNRRIEFTLVTPEIAAAEEAAQMSEAAVDACAANIDSALADGGIQFAAGSTGIAPESLPVVEAISAALEDCPNARFEIGGHTDAQGSEDGNLRISQQRAEAVLEALRKDGLALPGLVAKGYGESDPIADNATAEGRAANRRITFTALDRVAGPVPVDGPQAAIDAAGPPDASARAEALDARLGVDPDTACSDGIEAILAGGSIQFEAGSSEITEESAPLIDAISAVLRACPDVAFEIGGHTDSQGSEGGNQRLSQSRAEAVLAALRSDALPLPAVTAHGYGESEPIADNATADGRAANRRIAFNLVTAEGGIEAEGDADGQE